MNQPTTNKANDGQTHVGFKISWIATFFALLGQVTVIYKNPWAFVFWSIGEGILLSLAIKRKEWGEVSFFTLYVLTNMIALVTWLDE